jgi:hypothetical protein
MSPGDSSGQAGQIMGLMGSYMRPGDLILDSSGQLSSLQVGQVMGLVVTTGHEQAHMKAQTHKQAHAGMHKGNQACRQARQVGR